MAKTINKTMEKNFVSPVGRVVFCRVNTAIDTPEGSDKEYYNITVVFDDSAVERKMKAQIDKWLADGKKSPEFDGKKWRSGDDLHINYYTVNKGSNEGKIAFRFRTSPYILDFDTKESKRKYIPIWDKYGKKIGNDVAIGNGSEVQVRCDPTVYWNSGDGNGLNMYLSGIVVKNLIEFGGSNEAPTGFTFDAPPDASDIMAADEDVPI